MAGPNDTKGDKSAMTKEGMDRRTFLKIGGVLAAAGVSFPASQLLVASTMASTASPENPKISSVTGKLKKYTMVVDLNLCDGCKICEDSCRNENNVPLYTGDEAKNTAYWLRIASAKRDIPDQSTEERPVPLLCNHCDDAPCAHVCPTKATFHREDGLVMIDEHRCIGCRYCVIACPYHARSMVFRDTSDDEWTNHQVPKLMRGVASKCTFCVHRLDQDRIPRCVEDCPKQALKFGDRNDPESEVSRLLEPGKAIVLRQNLEVGPNVFYLGL